MGVGHTDSETAQHFWLRKTFTKFSCAPDAGWVRTSDLWISNPTLYQLIYAITTVPLSRSWLSHSILKLTCWKCQLQFTLLLRIVQVWRSPGNYSWLVMNMCRFEDLSPGIYSWLLIDKCRFEDLSPGIYSWLVMNMCRFEDLSVSPGACSWLLIDKCRFDDLSSDIYSWLSMDKCRIGDHLVSTLDCQWTSAGLKITWYLLLTVNWQVQDWRSPGIIYSWLSVDKCRIGDHLV